MGEVKSFLRDLDEAVSRGTPESRARALWHTTDLMVAGRYSDDEIWTFGEVIGRLADEIEVTARAQLAKRLARFEDAPVNIIHKLAFDDSIEVAGSDPAGVRTARALCAGRQRLHQEPVASARDLQARSLEESVTDVLVTRGNQEVVNSVATNTGAHFSDFGFLHMVQRAEGDSILAEHLGLRKDIPRHVFQQLIAKASDDVKRRLLDERPEMVEQIRSTVADVAGALQSKFGPASRSYFVAKRVVATQHRQGNLNETSISVYARTHKLEEVTIGLSLLCVIARRRDRTRAARQQQGNAADPRQGAQFLLGDDHGAAVPRRQGSPHHRPGIARSGARIRAPQYRDLAQRSGILSVPQEHRQEPRRRCRGEAAGRARGLVNDGSGTGRETSAMKHSHSAPPRRHGTTPISRRRTRPLDAAWLVLEAANDLGDHATVEICRRVIDANLNGTPVSPSDLHVITEYFR